MKKWEGVQEILDEEGEGRERGGELGEDGEEEGNEEETKEEEVERVKEEVEKISKTVEERRKRSPACLMRCLKTRRLHPAQCHALC